MSAAIHHLALTCNDRLAQEKFYSRHFGYRRVRVFNAGRPNEFVMLRLGQSCLELFQASGAAAGASPRQPETGFRHFCFQVPDVARKAEELKQDGIEPGPVVDCSDQVPGLKVCFFKDPEGNTIELMEGWQDDPALR